MSYGMYPFSMLGYSRLAHWSNRSPGTNLSPSSLPQRPRIAWPAPSRHRPHAFSPREPPLARRRSQPVYARHVAAAPLAQASGTSSWTAPVLLVVRPDRAGAMPCASLDHQRSTMSAAAAASETCGPVRSWFFIPLGVSADLAQHRVKQRGNGRVRNGSVEAEPSIIQIVDIMVLRRVGASYARFVG